MLPPDPFSTMCAWRRQPCAAQGLFEVSSLAAYAVQAGRRRSGERGAARRGARHAGERGARKSSLPGRLVRARHRRRGVSQELRQKAKVQGNGRGS